MYKIPTVDYGTILVAAIVAQVFYMIWYGRHCEEWMKLTGKKKTDKSCSGQNMLYDFINNFVVGFVVACIISWMGVKGYVGGAKVGAVVAAIFYYSAFMPLTYWEGYKTRLMHIHVVGSIIATALMGAVIAGM